MTKLHVFFQITFLASFLLCFNELHDILQSLNFGCLVIQWLSYYTGRQKIYVTPY